MLKKLFMVLSIAMIAMLVLAACGDDDDDDDADTSSSTATTSTTSGTTTSGSSVDVTAVKMEDSMKFDPGTITVAAGEEVTIELDNAGAIEHNFSVDDADVDHTVDPGKSDEITFTAPSEPGEYEIYCNVPGHKAAGMVAKLVVE